MVVHDCLQGKMQVSPQGNLFALEEALPDLSTLLSSSLHDDTSSMSEGSSTAVQSTENSDSAGSGQGQAQPVVPASTSGQSGSSVASDDDDQPPAEDEAEPRKRKRRRDDRQGPLQTACMYCRYTLLAA